jgi:hypothetical protein
MATMVETYKKALVAVVTAAAIVALGLNCGSAQAQSRWLAAIENPYCAISTYRLRDLDEQAMSATDRRGLPLIVVSGTTLKDRPSYTRFLLAHECCHHSLGHVGRSRVGLGNVGPQPFFYIAPVLKQMELEADCCAIKLLRSKQEKDGIAAAREAMVRFGPKPTGAHYPTGLERVDTIDKCAVQD